MARDNFATNDAIADGAATAIKKAALPHKMIVKKRLEAIFKDASALSQTSGCCGFAGVVMWSLDRDAAKPDEANNLFKKLCDYAFGIDKPVFPNADYDFTWKKMMQTFNPSVSQSLEVLANKDAKIDLGRRLSWRLTHDAWLEHTTIVDLAVCVTLMVLFKIHTNQRKEFKINGKQWASDRKKAPVSPVLPMRGKEAIMDPAIEYSKKFSPTYDANDRKTRTGAAFPEMAMKKGDLALPFFGLWSLLEFAASPMLWSVGKPPAKAPCYFVPPGWGLRAEARGNEEAWLPDPIVKAATGPKRYPPLTVNVTGKTPAEAAVINAERTAALAGGIAAVTAGFTEAGKRAEFAGRKIGLILGVAGVDHATMNYRTCDQFLDIVHWVYVPPPALGADYQIWTWGQKFLFANFVATRLYLPIWGIFVDAGPA